MDCGHVWSATKAVRVDVSREFESGVPLSFFVGVCPLRFGDGEEGVLQVNKGHFDGRVVGRECVWVCFGQTRRADGKP